VGGGREGCRWVVFGVGRGVVKVRYGEAMVVVASGPE
jgi:hypothetical protein